MNPGIIDSLVVQTVDVEDDLQGLTELLQPWGALNIQGWIHEAQKPSL